MKLHTHNSRGDAEQWWINFSSKIPELDMPLLSVSEIIERVMRSLITDYSITMQSLEIGFSLEGDESSMLFFLLKFS